MADSSFSRPDDLPMGIRVDAPLHPTPNSPGRILHSPDVFVFHSPVHVTLHLDSRGADVDRWARGGAPAELLKSNSGRKVWRVAAGEPALFVKRFPREMLRDRARKEADLLAALERAGIPCPRLAAVARDKDGSYILTEEIPRSRTLSEALARDGATARPLLAALGVLTRKLHDAGFEHQDFHAGNVLVSDGSLFVIDVHRAQHRRSLSRERRLEGVAFMAMSFSELRPLTDLVRYLRAYGLTSREEWLAVWKRLRRRRDRYFRGRQQRCFKEGTGFGVDGKTIYRKDVDLPALLDRTRTGRREVIKAKGGESLNRVDATLFVKETRPSRARRIWENAHGLAVRGIDTPRLWAWGGSQVTGEWIDSRDLYGYVREVFHTLSKAARGEFLHRLARFVRRMHDRGVYHADLKAANVLVGDGRIVVVDLDRVRFSVDVPERDRMFNLAQLNAAVTPPLTRSDRLRFLHAYFGNCRSLWNERSRWVREIMRMTVARAHHWPAR
jgi:tRNA A-37 threonylcarbamoyl transferase component Bud32